MNTTDKLEAISNYCICSTEISVNAHKQIYSPITDYIADNEIYEDCSKEVLDKILETGNIVEIYAFANTPVSHIKVTHYDLNAALDKMMEVLEINWS